MNVDHDEPDFIISNILLYQATKVLVSVPRVNLDQAHQQLGVALEKTTLARWRHLCRPTSLCPRANQAILAEGRKELTGSIVVT